LGRSQLSFEFWLDIPSSISVPFKTIWDLQHFRLPQQGGVQCVELWSPPVVLLPGVDQLFSEPAGQQLTHPVEQLGQLNVVIPIVLPKEALGLKETRRQDEMTSKKRLAKVEI